MTNLEKKIVAFIREAGDKSKYTPEQQKIYTAFTKTSGSKIYLRVTDKFNVSYKLYMPTGYYLEKIMTKHYQGAKGMVTAFEILNLLDVIEQVISIGILILAIGCIIRDIVEKEQRIQLL